MVSSQDSGYFAWLSYDSEENILFVNTTEDRFVTHMDITEMFAGLTALESIEFNKVVDFSNVRFIKGLFKGDTALTEVDMSYLDTSKVTDMASLFEGCENLVKVNVSTFNTKKVTTMDSMFKGCAKLEYLNLANFNTSAVTDFDSMFEGCVILQDLYLSENFVIDTTDTCEKMFVGFAKDVEFTKNAKSIIYGLDADTANTIAGFIDGKEFTVKASIASLGYNVLAEKEAKVSNAVITISANEEYDGLYYLISVEGENNPEELSTYKIYSDADCETPATFSTYDYTFQIAVDVNNNKVAGLWAYKCMGSVQEFNLASGDVGTPFDSNKLVNVTFHEGDKISLIGGIATVEFVSDITLTCAVDSK